MGSGRESGVDAVEARLLASIATLKSGLSGSAENTRAMVEALETFEAKVEKLQDAVRPVNELTEKLSLAQRNMNRTLIQLDKIHQHFETVEKAEKILLDSSRLQLEDRKRRKEYFTALEKLSSTQRYLRKKAEFQSTRQALEKSASLQAFAVRAIGSEFARLLEDSAATLENYRASEVGDLLLQAKHVSVPADSEKEKIDIIALHSHFPENTSDRLRELATCLEACGLSDNFIREYSSSRGRIVIDLFEESAEGMVIVELPPQRSFPADEISNDTSSFTGNSAKVSATAISAFSTLAPSSGRSDVSGPVTAEDFDDDDAASEVGSVYSTSSKKSTGSQSKRKKWKARFGKLKSVISSKKKKKDSFEGIASTPNMPFRGGSVTDNVSMARLPPLHPAATVQVPMQPPPPPDSPASHTSANSTGISAFGSLSSGLSRRKLSRQEKQTPAPAPPSTTTLYKTGDHIMLQMIQIAEYVFRSEMVLAVKVLPRGRKGRRVFLDAMLAPCETLASIGMQGALQSTRERYPPVEAVFAMLDVLQKICVVRPSLEDSLCPDSFEYLQVDPARGRSYSAENGPSSPRPGSPRLDPLPTAAWNQLMLFFSSWKSYSLTSLEEARHVLTESIQGIPLTATVHPQTIAVAAFLRRLGPYFHIVQDLLEGKDPVVELGRDGNPVKANAMDMRRAFSDFVASIINDYTELLLETEKQDTSRSPCAVQVFLLNNMTFLVQAVEEDEYLFPALEGTDSFARRKSDINAIKNRYLETLLSPILPLLAERQPQGVVLDTLQRDADAGTLSTAAKRAVKDYCGQLRSWIDGAYHENSKLEVPDFELRTELRYLIRSAILPRYKNKYALMGNVRLSKKADEKLMVFDPDEFSTLVSQFFEVSETVSNPKALPVSEKRSMLARTFSRVSR